VRAFIALDLDQPLLDAAVRVRDRLERTAPKGARFTPAEKIHVTLAFLGEIDSSQTPTIASGLEPLAGAPLAIAWTSLDAFPSKTRARVIVIGLDDDGTLAALASSVQEHAEALGIEQEERAYRPHLTLARLNAPANVTDWLGAIDPARGTATALTLYVSRAGKYEALARFPFTSTGSR
jgi:2'-5' RNA ligase